VLTVRGPLAQRTAAATAAGTTGKRFVLVFLPIFFPPGGSSIGGGRG